MAENSWLPLAGRRVLDFGHVLSVPYLGGLLADLGAEVLKIEAPHRTDVTRGFRPYLDDDPTDEPWNRAGLLHAVNRGKRSFIVDMTTPAGKDIPQASGRQRRHHRKLHATSDAELGNEFRKPAKGQPADHYVVELRLRCHGPRGPAAHPGHVSGGHQRHHQIHRLAGMPP
jgi:hypothetical protein